MADKTAKTLADAHIVFKKDLKYKEWKEEWEDIWWMIGIWYSYKDMVDKYK